MYEIKSEVTEAAEGILLDFSESVLLTDNNSLPYLKIAFLHGRII